LHPKPSGSYEGRRVRQRLDCIPARLRRHSRLKTISTQGLPACFSIA
jgi:hypothetical protein